MNKLQKGFIVRGSVTNVAESTGRSIEETLMDVECVVFVDTSASMAAQDSRDNQSRYDVACVELAKLQNQMSGKIAVVSFSGSVQLCPDGVPTFLRGSTDVAGALRYGRKLDKAFDMRFIVISDGEPDDSAKALKEAKRYKNRIDTIYVGNEGASWARKFLEDLAAASGGKSVTDEAAASLLETTKTLLLSST